jgi:dephospho-CoA kinase
MGLIYVTGIAGSGKSEVCNQLTKLGYEAHEGDVKLSAFYNNESGEVVKRPVSIDERTTEWRKSHTWKMSRKKLLKLKIRAAEKPIFVCGVATNEDEYIDVFDVVFALSIDDDTLMHRIKTRAADSFGKNKNELETIREWQKSTEAYYLKIGAHVIDASQPITAVVGEIVASI